MFYHQRLLPAIGLVNIPAERHHFLFECFFHPAREMYSRSNSIIFFIHNTIKINKI